MDLSDKTFVNSDGEVVEYDGSPVYWRVSAYSIIIQNKQVFLVRSEGESLFDVPGGGIEFNETVKEALSREAMEEAGLEIKPGSVLGCHQDYFFHRIEKKFYKTLLLYYSAHINAINKPKESKIIFADFVDLKDLNNYPTLPWVKEIIFDQVEK